MFVFFDLFGCIGNREIQRLPVVSLLQRQGIGAVAKQGGVDGYFPPEERKKTETPSFTRSLNRRLFLL